MILQPNTDICKRCFNDKNETKMFSKENLMDPGSVPEELQNLSITEQQLICRISPAINVHLLKHGGIAAKGHCVTFPQEINEPAKIFPRLPAEINVVRVRKQGSNDSSKDFTVRRYKIQNALQWLKNNNPAYFDIQIDSSRLNALPIDGELNEIHEVQYHNSAKHFNDRGPAPQQTDPDTTTNDDHDFTSGVLLPDPTVNIQEQVNAIIQQVTGNTNQDYTKRKNSHPIIPWPTRNNEPVSEFTTRHFFTLAFSTLFPHNKGDFFANRPRTCDNMSEWAEHILWYKDGRFARHKYFKFILHNMIVHRQVLHESNFVVRQSLGDNHVEVSDLLKKLQNGDDSILKKILYFGSNLRGTSQYWGQRKKEIHSLIEYQIHNGNGLPSIFATGSCAEYHWKPLRRLLKIYLQETTGTDVDINDKNILYQALQDNTHIVGQYFDLRTTSYFKEIMGPVFGTDTYFYKQEFAKSRGMIHWHGLLWRSDMEPHNLLWEALQSGKSLQNEAAQIVATWANKQFGLTALHPAGSDTEGNPRKDLWPPPHGTCPAPPDEKNPLIKLLMDVSDSQQTLLEDHLLLTNRVNIHQCSDYCLKKKN